ncbi:MAG: GNAT family N-acetyltransferase [Acidobacteria bacterium]|nr:GNAT family N-acetyltransferase [Acidobacteriota bacterium]
MEAMSIGIETFHAGIRITEMTPEILTSVVTLEEECGLNSRGIEGYRKMLLNPNAILLVAIEGDELVIGAFSGTVVVDDLQIDNLAVSARRRRKGIGQSLLRSALSLAKRLGARTATLEVRSSNLPARSLYEKEGFVVDGFRSRYYAAPSDDALLLSREI